MLNVEITNPTGQDYKEDFDIANDDDKVLSKKIDSRFSESKDLHEKACDIADENMKLFRSRIDEIKDTRPALAKYNSKTVIAKIFTTIRNLVGMTTDNKVKIHIVPGRDDQKSITRAKKLENCLEYGYMRTHMNTILAECLIDTWVKRDSYIRWFWDYDMDDFGAEAVKLENLRISPEAKNIQDAEYVIYFDYKNRKWFKKHFPDNYKDIVFRDYEAVSQKYGVYGKTEEKRGNVALYMEYWEDGLVVKKVKQQNGEDDLILEKKMNPYYEWRSEEEQLQEVLIQQYPELAELSEVSGMDVVSLLQQQSEERREQAERIGEAYEDEFQTFLDENFKPITNYFKIPRKPFVQIPSFKMLGQLYSENMIGDHIKSVFLSMNDKKRSYNDNISGCNSKLVIDKNFFDKDKAQKITNEPYQKLFVDMQTNPKPVYIEQGKEVPNSFHLDIRHDEQIIDDIFGHHEISRGTGESNTLGQDQINAQSDRTPVRYQTRLLESALLEVYEGWIQLIKMFYTEAKSIKQMGKKEGYLFDEIINDDVDEGVEPYIRPGSLLPISDAEKTQRAMGLWSSNALDPYTLFAEMGMNNPAELADRLVNWIKFGMVSSEDPDKIAADLNNDPNSPGGMMQNSIEQADQENEAMQNEAEVPPTPPELLSQEHVKLHYDFLKDPKIKLSDEAYDLVSVHADVDKAGLARIMAMQMTKEAGSQIAPKGKELEKKKLAGK
jgi:hypothetical protein